MEQVRWKCTRSMQYAVHLLSMPPWCMHSYVPGLIMAILVHAILSFPYSHQLHFALNAASLPVASTPKFRHTSSFITENCNGYLCILHQSVSVSSIPGCRFPSSAAQGNCLVIPLPFHGPVSNFAVIAPSFWNRLPHNISFVVFRWFFSVSAWRPFCFTVVFCF